MNCRAWVIGQYKPFIVVEPNSNVLWVTCSTSHKHESCTLRFHIRTSTAVRCLWDAFLHFHYVKNTVMYVLHMYSKPQTQLLQNYDGRNKIFFSNQTQNKGVDDCICTYILLHQTKKTRIGGIRSSPMNLRRVWVETRGFWQVLSFTHIPTTVCVLASSPIAL